MPRRKTNEKVWHMPHTEVLADECVFCCGLQAGCILVVVQGGGGMAPTRVGFELSLPSQPSFGEVHGCWVGRHIAFVLPRRSSSRVRNNAVQARRSCQTSATLITWRALDPTLLSAPPLRHRGFQQQPRWLFRSPKVKVHHASLWVGQRPSLIAVCVADPLHATPRNQAN